MYDGELHQMAAELNAPRSLTRLYATYLDSTVRQASAGDVFICSAPFVV